MLSPQPSTPQSCLEVAAAAGRKGPQLWLELVAILCVPFSLHPVLILPGILVTLPGSNANKPFWPLEELVQGWVRGRDEESSQLEVPERDPRVDQADPFY